jgi:predicted GIY-YIG superfamily endonuclease
MSRCSLYRHFSETGDLLYIGVSLSTLVRLGQHAKHSGWFASIARVEVEHFDNREAALAAERAAIENEAPLHNKHHKRVPEPSSFAVEEEEIAFEKTKQRLVHRIVNVSPLYTVNEAARVLCVSNAAAKKLILGAVILLLGYSRELTYMASRGGS